MNLLQKYALSKKLGESFQSELDDLIKNIDTWITTLDSVKTKAFINTLKDLVLEAHFDKEDKNAFYYNMLLKNYAYVIKHTPEEAQMFYHNCLHYSIMYLNKEYFIEMVYEISEQIANEMV